MTFIQFCFLSQSSRGHLGQRAKSCPSSSLQITFVTLHPTGDRYCTSVRSSPDHHQLRASGAGREMAQDWHNLTHRILLLGQAEGRFLLELHMVASVVGPHFPRESWKSKRSSARPWPPTPGLQGQEDPFWCHWAPGDILLLRWAFHNAVTLWEQTSVGGTELGLGDSWVYGVDRSFQRCRTAAHASPWSLRVSICAQVLV